MGKSLRLSWRFAWRDLTGGPSRGPLGGFRGLGIFLACLVLGVTAIAAVGSLSQSFVAGLDRDGTKLLGGDVDLRLPPGDAAGASRSGCRRARAPHGERARPGASQRREGPARGASERGRRTVI